MEFGDYGTIMSGNPFLKMTPEAEKFAGEVFEKMRGEQDPGKRMRILLESINDFYGASWTGTINVDLPLGIWTPTYWYDPENGHMGPTLFNDYEYSDDFNLWVEALNHTGRLFTLDVEKIRWNFPVEYQHYKRMEAELVHAVPFDGTITGFLIVRNPTKNDDSAKLLEFLVYFVSGEQYKLRLLSRMHHSLKPMGIEHSNDLIINLFGDMAIQTKYGVIDVPSFGTTKIGRIIAYLVLKKNHSATPATLARAICDGDPTPDEIADKARKVKQYIYHFKVSHGALFGEEQLIIPANGEYMLNPYYNLKTDIARFDDLRTRLRGLTDIDEKITVLKTLVKIYRGIILNDTTDNEKFSESVNDYHKRYIDCLMELCGLLRKKKDYDTIFRYTNRALSLEWCNHKIYRWNLLALHKTENHSTGRKVARMAKRNLASDDYIRMKNDLIANNGESIRPVFDFT